VLKLSLKNAVVSLEVTIGMGRPVCAVTIALTGSAGLSGAEADHVLAVPSTDSALIQEIHLMLIHVWCQAVDEASD